MIKKTLFEVRPARVGLLVVAQVRSSTEEILRRRISALSGQREWWNGLGDYAYETYARLRRDLCLTRQPGDVSVCTDTRFEDVV